MRLATAVLGVALALAAVTSPTAQADDELASFETCADVVHYAEGGAGLDSWPAWSEPEGSSLGLRSPYREPSADRRSGMIGYDDDNSVVPEEESDSAGGAETEDDVSGTNTQEQGIDEPDLFKTDARLLFVIAGSELRVVTARTDVPRAIARLPLEIADGQLLRTGDKLLAIGYVPGAKQQNDDGSISRYAKYPRRVRLIEIDIKDRAAPRVLRTMDALGEMVAARQTGSTVRLVINTLVDEGWEYDEEDDSYGDVELDVDDVLPATQLKSNVTGDRYQRRMAPCEQVDRPAGFSGNDLVSIFTFDLEKGLIGIRREALMANAQVVYASPTTLYIASGRYVDWEFTKGLPEDTYTDVHAFDLTTPGQTNYAGTGRVLGVPLNKYSFSESGGDLRVATTTEPGWVKEQIEVAAEEQCDEDYGDEAEEDDEGYDAEEWDCEDYDDWKAPDIPVDNRVTVLRREGAGFVQRGVVEGLGRGGSIDAVRFDGPRGYVATSSKDAPLITLDLEDPTAPKAVGQLKIPGYSAYLHPLGDGLVLGIGQDAPEADNGNEWIGGVVSLFDVEDPAHPKRLAKRNLGRGYSGAETDPHAFLWWPRKKLVLLPYTRWTDTPDWWYSWEGTGELVGLTASRTGASNLEEIDRITHGPDWDHPGVVRGVVFGDRLLSISELGIGTSRVGDLSPLGYLPHLPYVQNQKPAKRCSVPGTTPLPTTPGTTPTGTAPSGTTPAGTTPPGTTPAGTTPTAASAPRAQAAAPDAPGGTSTDPTSPTTPASTTPTTPTTPPATPTTPTPTPPPPWAAPWSMDPCAAKPDPVPGTTPPGTTPSGTTPSGTTPSGTTPAATTPSRTPIP